MKSIVIREIRTFFGSPIGYLVIAIFLLLNGLFLWIFQGDYTILNSGFADVTPFFTIAPWILLFLIPAVTMRSFSDEIKQGTIELLLTKPLSLWEIIGGKFLGAIILISIAIVPTFLYVFTISYYTQENMSLEFGSIFGSYLGLFFLISVYCAIGIFTSTLSENQIVAFILSVFLCFFFYYGFSGIADLMPTENFDFSTLGMEYHFKSISRGIIDTRDLIYFSSSTFLFLSFTVFKLKAHQS